MQLGSKSLTVAVTILLLVAGCGPADSSHSPPRGDETTTRETPQQVRETVMLNGPPFCAQTCVGLTSWYDLIPGGLLRAAAAVSYTYNYNWRPMARSAAAGGT